MNERQLNYFFIIAEEKSLGRAATRLPLSLSALSRQMQALEEELGVTLFKRTGSGLTLTPAGEALLKHAKALRDQFEMVRREVQQTGTRVHGRLNVGGFGAVTLVYLPQLLKAFKEHYPNVEEVVHTAPGTQLLDSLRQGRLNAYFDRIREPPEGCSAELAFPDSTVLALPEGHPLSTHAEIAPEALRDQPIIGRHDERNNPPEMRHLIQNLGFPLKIVQRVQDMVTSTSMVGSGMGIAFVAASVQRLNIANVIFRPLRTDTPLCSDIYCVYRQGDDSPILRALLRLVRAHLEDARPGA